MEQGEEVLKSCVAKKEALTCINIFMSFSEQKEKERRKDLLVNIGLQKTKEFQQGFFFYLKFLKRGQNREMSKPGMPEGHEADEGEM